MYLFIYLLPFYFSNICIDVLMHGGINAHMNRSMDFPAVILLSCWEDSTIAM